MRKFVIIAIGLMTLALAGAFVVHSNPLCGEETIMGKTSPDGHYVAALS